MTKRIMRVALMFTVLLAGGADAADKKPYHLHVDAYPLPTAYEFSYDALPYRVISGRRSWGPGGYEVRTTVFQRGAVRIVGGAKFTLQDGTARWVGDSAPRLVDGNADKPFGDGQVREVLTNVGTRSRSVIMPSTDDDPKSAKEAWFLYEGKDEEKHASHAVFRMDLALRPLESHGEDALDGGRVRFTKFQTLTYHTQPQAKGEAAKETLHTYEVPGVDLDLGDAMAVLVESNHPGLGSMLLVIRVGLIDLDKQARGGASSPAALAVSEPAD